MKHLWMQWRGWWAGLSRRDAITMELIGLVLSLIVLFEGHPLFGMVLSLIFIFALMVEVVDEVRESYSQIEDIQNRAERAGSEDGSDLSGPRM